MGSQAKQFDKQFKIDAVRYVKEHPDLSLEQCAKNLGIGLSTLSRWRRQFETSGGEAFRGSGNYSSDIEKENARLKRELRDAQDALDDLICNDRCQEGDKGRCKVFLKPKAS